MYMLHAHWQPPAKPTETGALLVWAENALAPQPPKSSKSAKARPHLFCADAATVHRLLNELTACGGTTNRDQLTLRLPTTRTGPQPSPHLLHTWELDTRTAPALAAWYIDADQLAPMAAYKLLTRLPTASELPPHVRLGDDLQFWSTALQLVLEALAQQKLLPALAPIDAAGKQYHAR